MKKVLVIALSAALCVGCLAFAGCGNSQEKQDGGDTPATGMANPLHESDQAGVLEATGLDLVAPEGAVADSVAYFYIDPEEEGGNSMAELRYTDAAGVEWTYRAQSIGELENTDISGMYYEWAEETTGPIGEAKIMADVKTCDEAAICYWLDIVPGIQYCLSAGAKVSADEILAAANQVYVPTQGED